MDQSIHMLNAVWFRKDGGIEKYMEYGAAVRPLLKKAGAEVGTNYVPEAALVGEWDPDMVFIVRYPSQAIFDAMFQSPEYEKIRHLREEALEKSLLISCKAFDWSIKF